MRAETVILGMAYTDFIISAVWTIANALFADIWQFRH